MPTGATRARNGIETAFRLLYAKLHSVSQRKCISATSKLLWCRFPDDIVIYDSFVERAVTVLQHIDPAIMNMPKLGPPPRLSSNVNGAIDYYMRYQDLVYALFKHYEPHLQGLSKSNPNPQRNPHLLRLFDRFLLRLGTP